ncbi:MAG TPA: M17 family metallopeptidase [Candidatus Micrarchaeia archaeon]|nr:M17 family metallopeptidase [Candidatus Micrarchaeia archaeon]
MDLTVCDLAAGVADAQLWVLPVCEDVGLAEAAAVVDRQLGGGLSQVAQPAAGGRLGRRATVWVTRAGAGPVRLVAVGLGRGAAVDGYGLRNAVELALRGQAAAGAAILLDRRTLAALGVVRDLGAAAALRLALEGAVRATGDWGRSGDGAVASLGRVVVATDWEGIEGRDRAAADAALLGSAANRVRRWQWTPSNHLTPARFAAEAVRLGGEAGLEAEVLEQAELRRSGYGGILGVAQGSAEAPCLVVLRHRPPRPGPVLGLVGKGVTFDAGGMAIKPAKDLHLMKSDMSGAAAVLGALLVVASWRPAVGVIGVLPLSENVLGTGSMKSGDVVAMADGTTVEVTNPDAEGRLLLADGLVHARLSGATHLVSIGTLTDAVSLAQGPTVSGAIGADDTLLAQLEAAAALGGERLLRLRMYPEYDDVLDSDVAAVRNEADDLHEEPVAAAVFLRRFVERAAWVHLDIGGSASNEHANLYDVVPRGPSAVATATLAHLTRVLAETVA